MAALSFLGSFLYSQLLVTPTYPTKPFTGQTVIVTGSNTGLGLEAARHITRLNAARVILAVRNTAKGEAAKASIESTTGRTGIVEVWPLDLQSYESVKAFAARATKELTRVDVLLENAGMMISKFEIVEQDETTVTTNVTSTFLLALLMLPKLKETAQRFNVMPRLTVVSSDAHVIAQFSERKADNIFAALNDEATVNMGDRYGVSKLLEILLVRQLQSHLPSPSPIIVNTLTPGACRSDFFREEMSFLTSLVLSAAIRVFARTTEVGSRTLVLAASAGEETAGKYMADGVVRAESAFVRSDEGAQTERKLWKELMQKLERVSPGIEKAVS